MHLNRHAQCFSALLVDIVQLVYELLVQSHGGHNCSAPVTVESKPQSSCMLLLLLLLHVCQPYHSRGYPLHTLRIANMLACLIQSAAGAAAEAPQHSAACCRCCSAAPAPRHWQLQLSSPLAGCPCPAAAAAAEHQHCRYHVEHQMRAAVALLLATLLTLATLLLYRLPAAFRPMGWQQLSCFLHQSVLQSYCLPAVYCLLPQTWPARAASVCAPAAGVCASCVQGQAVLGPGSAHAAGLPGCQPGALGSWRWG